MIDPESYTLYICDENTHIGLAKDQIASNPNMIPRVKRYMDWILVTDGSRSKVERLRQLYKAVVFHSAALGFSRVEQVAGGAD